MAIEDKLIVNQIEAQRRERTDFEPSPLHRISDEQLFQAISCHGFLQHFQPETQQLESTYQQVLNPHTEAYEYVRSGTIQDRQSNAFTIRYARDLDNIGVSVFDSDGASIIHLKLRDRRFDGTPEATSPRYLRETKGLAEDEIPERSRYIGGTNWYYSGETDVPASGQHAVEFSIVSSDSCKRLHTTLGGKEESLWVPADRLAQFIDDPFASLPVDNPTPERLNEWYTMWWQVANRGLRGKTIPNPGQVSERGFQGFFKHTVAEVSTLLHDLGYTHLSGVPTWQYVWSLNLSHEFYPENAEQHEQALSFFTALNEISLPFQSRRDGYQQKVGDLDPKDSVRSWLAVLPYALALDTSLTPHLDIPDEYAIPFDALLQATKTQLEGNEGIKTYPLAPNRNLWHSKKV